MNANPLVKKLNEWSERVVKSTMPDSNSIDTLAIISDINKIVAEELNKETIITE